MMYLLFWQISNLWQHWQINNIIMTLVRKMLTCVLDVVYLRLSKVSIYISSPQGLVWYHGLFDINYHSKLREYFVCLFKNLSSYVIRLKLEINRAWNLLGLEFLNQASHVT